MDVHASPAELPELQEFLGAFQVRFRRPEGRAALKRYTTGLLTDRKDHGRGRRSGPACAARVPTCEGVRHRPLTRLLGLLPAPGGSAAQPCGSPLT
jgi:hypothetical protein